MIRFMNETAMAGYEMLLDNSINYKNDVGHLSETMNDFADESMHLNTNIDSIKEAVDAVNIAVGESAKGIVGVTEMSSDMTVRRRARKNTTPTTFSASAPLCPFRGSSKRKSGNSNCSHYILPSLTSRFLWKSAGFNVIIMQINFLAI